jgi:hypothetical protein
MDLQSNYWIHVKNKDLNQGLDLTPGAKLRLNPWLRAHLSFACFPGVKYLMQVKRAPKKRSDKVLLYSSLQLVISAPMMMKNAPTPSMTAVFVKALVTLP